MTRKILIIIIIFLLPLNLFAQSFNWGINIDNLSTLGKTDAVYFAQNDLLNLWMRFLFSDQISIRASGHGLLRYNTDYSLAGLTDPAAFKFYGDLDRFFLYGKMQGQQIIKGIEFSLGRFLASDKTGLLCRQKLDGGEFTLRFNPFSLRFWTGYTGLLLKNSFGSLLSPEDIIRYADEQSFMASSRLIGGTDITLLFLPKQEIYSFFFGQVDLNPLKNPDAAALHSFYTGFGWRGRIKSLHIKAAAAYNGGTAPFEINAERKQRPIHAFMTDLKLQFLPRKAAFLAASLEGFFSSGDKQSRRMEYIPGSGASDTLENSHQFVAVSAPLYGQVLQIKTGNLAFIKAAVNLRPFYKQKNDLLNKLQPFLAGSFFFRPVVGPVSVIGLSENSTSYYLGTEVDFGLHWRPLRDLSLAVEGGILFPSRSAFSTNRSKTELRLDFYLSTSF